MGVFAVTHPEIRSRRHFAGMTKDKVSPTTLYTDARFGRGGREAWRHGHVVTRRVE